MKNINAKKANINKGRIGLVIGFIVWTVLSGMFFVKNIGPSVSLYILQDNVVYTNQYGNPANWEEKDNAYNEYADYVQSLITSDDAMVSFYAKQNVLVKAILMLASVVPFAFIAIFVHSLVNEYKEEKAKQLRRRQYNSRYIRQS